MSGIYRKATVYVQKMPAGRLEETEDGYRFAYFPEYCDREGAIAVSLTLPLRMEPYLECCWLRAVIVLEMSVFKERSDNALLVLWKGNVRKNL